VTEVQIGFAAVVGDEHLAVLERVHRAGVDVDVRIKFLHRDAQTTHLEQATKRRSSETFTESAGYTTCDEHMLCHFLPPVIII
jgi:hypothetical protein